MNTFFDFPLVYLPPNSFRDRRNLIIDRNHISRIQHFRTIFFRIGCIATSLLLFLGTIPLAADKALLATSLISVSSAIVLWRFLKQLTIENNETRVDEGFVNHEFTLSEPISRTSPGKHRYSSVTWASHTI